MIKNSIYDVFWDVELYYDVLDGDVIKWDFLKFCLFEF